MKTQTQILWISLSILIAVGLAFAVALGCMPHIKAEPLATVPPTADKPTDAPVEPEPSQASLQFIGNGDGTCVVIGIGSYTDTTLIIPEYAPSGERVTEIAAMAFYECNSITAVHIPASVERIGSLAFSACPNLTIVSVSPQNTSYCDLDGVLYTADCRLLLVYPARRIGSTASIPVSTEQIADMAFYQCQNLSLVVYAGSAEQWERIRIGTRNWSLIASAKRFEN